MRLLQSVDSVTDGNWGALNATGICENNDWGGDDADSTRPVGEGEATAVSSYVPRVVMTMYELCHPACAPLYPYIRQYFRGRQFDSLLRYFTTDSAYVDYLENGDWKAGYDRFVDTNISASPARSCLPRIYRRGKLRKLTLDMYGVLQSLPAAS